VARQTDVTQTTYPVVFLQLSERTFASASLISVISTCKEVARPERFELPALWFEALEAGNPNAFVCVA
jgi:hypothetical protein